MAKIELISKTAKNINELKRKDIQSINWATFPVEQIPLVDAGVYKKLTGKGRRVVNLYLKDYLSRDVEFWNVVMEHNDNSLATELWNNATTAIKRVMVANHPDFFEDYASLLPPSESDVITSKLSMRGFSYVWDQNEEAMVLLNPEITLEEFNAPFEREGVQYPTLLHFLYQELDAYNSIDDLPIPVPNAMLKAAGFPEIQTLNQEFLSTVDACSGGTIVARKWVAEIGTNGELTWDAAVEHYRNHPHLYKDPDVMYHLIWWYCNSVFNTLWG